jgi:hypothetical protein
MVGAQRFRQSILAKGRFKNRLHSFGVRFLHRLAAQQVPAVGIGDGRRIDALVIGGPEPALEISASHAFALLRRC